MTNTSTAPQTAADRPGTIAAPIAARHSAVEDVLGLLTGAVVASLGLFLLKTSAAVTGGTAGLALLLSYIAPIPFGAMFFAVNLPFFALALWKKGWSFTLRTALAVATVSIMSALYPSLLDIRALDPVFGVIAGNLLAGVGLLILFRHKASLGGFNILALVIQDRFGWRAGYVQMALDVTIVLVALAVVPPLNVLLSVVGAVVLNLVVAFNHRPGRYLGT